MSDWVSANVPQTFCSIGLGVSQLPFASDITVGSTQ